MRSQLSGGASLRIQLVLYQNNLAELGRTLQAIIATVAVAKRAGVLGHIELAVGDCSPERNIDNDTEVGLLRTALDNGFDAAWYDFFDENLGSAGGSNRLAEGAETDYLLVLNPDTYPGPRMILNMLKRFQAGIGVVEARQLPIEHPKQYDPVSGDVSWASGACSMFDRSVFETVGGYDTDYFFMHCDDVDISWRIKLEGFKVVTEPTAKTLHHKSIDADGGIRPPDFERYHGALGKLMLATRFQAPDAFEATIKWINESGDLAQQAAVAEFEKRQGEGSTPAPLEGASDVAQFVGTEYAVHRF